MVDLRDFDLSKSSVVRRLRKKRKDSVELRGEFFPRIHDVDEILRFVSLLSEYGEVTHDDIGRKSDQGLNHVFHTSKLLGLISEDETLTRLTANFHLRETREKLSLISLGIADSKAVKRWMEWQDVEFIFSIDLKTASDFVREMDPTIALSTNRARASSLRSLVKQAQLHHPSVTDSAESLLWPIDRLKRDTDVEPDNIFESGKSESIIEYLAHSSEFIRLATGYFSIDGYEIIASNLEGAQIRIIVGQDDHLGRNTLANPAENFRRSVENGPTNSKKRLALQNLHRELLFGTTRVAGAFARQHEAFHSKVYIFDRSAVLQGSMNSTRSGFRLNIENGDVKTSITDVDYFIKRFDDYFRESTAIEASFIEVITNSWALVETCEVNPGLAYLRILLELYGQEFDFGDKTEYVLDDYQRYTSNKAARDILQHGGCLLVAPTGTGKSVMGSFVALNLFKNQHIDRVIIVCPGHLEESWKRYMMQFRMGAITERLSFFREQKGTDEEREFFASSVNERDLVIIDESHNIKNDDSNGAENLMRAIGPPNSKNPYRLLMTATPYSKDFTDLNNQLMFVHPTAKAKNARDVAHLPAVAYLTHPLIANEFAKDVDGKKAVKFDKYMYFPIKATRRLTYDSNHKELFGLIEGLDLRMKRKIEIDKHQMRIIEDEVQISPGRSIELLRYTFARMAESSPAALQQLIENQLLKPLEETYHHGAQLRIDLELILENLNKTPDDNKLQLLLERLRPLVEAGHKILIFSEYKSTVSYLKNNLTKYFPEIATESIVGGLSDDAKSNILRRFAPVASGLQKRARKDDIQILIATDCISEGQNLQDATLLVNYDLTWTPLPLIQRIGRLDRPTPHHRTFGVWNFFPGQDFFERMIGIMNRLNVRSSDYQKMAGIEVIKDNIRDLDKLKDEELAHVRELYSTEEVDFDEVLNQFMPATEYMRRLATATESEIAEAWSLPVGTIAVLEKHEGSEGVVCLLRSDEGEFEVVWKERGEPVKSRFTGASQESILQKITVDLHKKGAILPEWFDEEQGNLLNQFATDCLQSVDDYAPVISICITKNLV